MLYLEFVQLASKPVPVESANDDDVSFFISYWDAANITASDILSLYEVVS